MKRTAVAATVALVLSLAACGGGGGSPVASPQSIGNRYPAQVQTLRDIDNVASPQTITDLRANPDDATAAYGAETALADSWNPFTGSAPQLRPNESLLDRAEAQVRAFQTIPTQERNSLANYYLNP